MAENLLAKVLRSIYVSDVIKNQELVFITAGESLSGTAKCLASAGISSVPVFNKKKEADTDGNVVYGLADCLGVVDFSDIVSSLMTLREKGYDERNPKKHIWSKFENMSVEKEIKFNAAKYIQISVKSTMLEAVEKCAEFGLRRMLAIDENDKVVAVLSPSEMMKHLLDALEKKEDVTLNKVISELAIGSTPVLTTSKKDRLMNAFKKMQKAQVSAIGIVDEKTGALQASLSMSDVSLLIKEQKSGFFTDSVWAYVTHKKDQEINERFPFFSVMNDKKLVDVMSRMLATKVHHLYVVNDDMKPAKMVSFADICRGLLTFKTHAG